MPTRRQKLTGIGALALAGIGAVTAAAVTATAAVPTPATGHGEPAARAATTPPSRLYTPPADSAAYHQLARLVKARAHRDAAGLLTMIRTPHAVWYGDQAPAEVEREVRDTTRAAARQHRLPVLTLYNVPGRDCANYSAGGAPDADAYRAWIDAVARGIGDRDALVILEPDSLTLLPQDCPDGEGAEEEPDGDTGGEDDPEESAEDGEYADEGEEGDGGDGDEDGDGDGWPGDRSPQDHLDGLDDRFRDWNPLARRERAGRAPASPESHRGAGSGPRGSGPRTPGRAPAGPTPGPGGTGSAAPGPGGTDPAPTASGGTAPGSADAGVPRPGGAGDTGEQGAGRPGGAGRPRPRPRAGASGAGGPGRPRRGRGTARVGADTDGAGQPTVPAVPPGNGSGGVTAPSTTGVPSGPQGPGAGRPQGPSGGDEPGAAMPGPSTAPAGNGAGLPGAAAPSGIGAGTPGAAAAPESAAVPESPVASGNGAAGSARPSGPGGPAEPSGPGEHVESSRAAGGSGDRAGDPSRFAAEPADERTAARYAAIRYAVDTLEPLPRTRVYLDAGHPGWHTVRSIVPRLLAAGADRATGFFLNVSGYRSDDENAWYGRLVSSCLALAGHGHDPASCADRDWSRQEARAWLGARAEVLDPARMKHFVTDTSRNGQGPWRPPAGRHPDPQDWCNPPGRGLGARPTLRTDDPLHDAALWVKTPGESDGGCLRGGPGPKDPERGMVAPPAGEWFATQALELVRLARPGIIPEWVGMIGARGLFPPVELTPVDAALYLDARRDADRPGGAASPGGAPAPDGDRGSGGAEGAGDAEDRAEPKGRVTLKDRVEP
nr:glycoside hydrolase family 6 protein [Streptomyces pactum]